jgi:hypothetical protein
MNLSTFADALWAAGFVGHVALLAVLMFRRRWREIPVFTAYMAFQAALTPVLYEIYRHGSPVWYAHVYWSSALLDFAFQIGIVAEIARIVLRPTGTWVQDAKRQFFVSGVGAVLLAAALAWFVSPPSANLLDRWEVRGNLFTSLVICELFVLMSITANRLGLGWRSHVMALGQGLTAWALIAVLIDALHSYLGTDGEFTTLEHIRMTVYVVALVFWMVQLWIDEPERQPISSDLQQYIVALHSRVKYDVGRVDHNL